MVRGEPVTVVDLPYMLFKTTSQLKEGSSTVLLCSTKKGDFAIYVHAVNGIIKMTEENFQPKPIVGHNDLVRNYFFNYQEIIMCLDLPTLLSKVVKEKSA